MEHQTQQQQLPTPQFRGPGSLLSLIRLSGLQELLSPLETGEFSELLSSSGVTSLSNLSHLQSTQTRGVLGDVKFIDNHSQPVKGVDFSPKDEHIFCSAGMDGKCNIYDARFSKLLSTFTMPFSGVSNVLTGAKFVADGRRLALTSHTNKVFLYDIEQNTIVQTIDRCVVSMFVQTRTPIAVDPTNSYSIMVPTVNGKGLTNIDIRSPTAIKTLDDIHDGNIHDIEILEPSWARAFHVDISNDPIILTASQDTTAKIIDSHKHIFKKFEMRSQVYSIAHTPEPPIPNSTHPLSSIAIGSDKLNVYPALQGSDALLSAHIPTKSVNRVRYTYSGNRLFVATSDGYLKMYNRLITGKKYDNMGGIVYKHGKDIQDLSISRNDEYIVTASSDHKIGLIKIGEPLFGSTEIGELL